MTDLQRLKNLNLLERVGWLVRRNPRKALIASAAVLLSVIIILSIPGIISAGQSHRAENYIAESELRLNRVNSTIEDISVSLKKNAGLYKELDSYQYQLGKDKDNLQALVSELSGIKKDLKSKEIKSVLNQFQSDKNKENLLPDKISTLEKNAERLSADITDIITIDTYLVSQYSTFGEYKDSINDCLKSRYENLSVIQSKGKTTSVKNKANQYFIAINKNTTNFINGFDTLKPYTSADQGTCTLPELKAIKQDYLFQATLLANTGSTIGAFDQYWNELHEQYYTIITNQYNTRSTDYVTEPNPQYRQWTETETYQDTETYTERVYVGSRIVNDQQEDIYETVTKTRPVTRTRTVNKDNGQPQMISVPYDVYSFYYTVERHTPSGVAETSVYAGKKHEKFDSSITAWSYQPNQSVGYIEWKQLWNDNGGIMTGKNISPSLE